MIGAGPQSAREYVTDVLNQQTKIINNEQVRKTGGRS